MRRGDISQMSFGFQVQEESWRMGEDGESDVRTLKKVRLFDVSPVTFPAYEGTDVAVRSHDAWKKEKREARGRTNILAKKLKLKEKI
jgi:phage head maturation protease